MRKEESSDTKKSSQIFKNEKLQIKNYNKVIANYIKRFKKKSNFLYLGSKFYRIEKRYNSKYNLLY